MEKLSRALLALVISTPTFRCKDSTNLPPCPRSFENTLETLVQKYSDKHGIAVVAGYAGPDGRHGHCASGAIAYPNTSQLSRKDDSREEIFAYGSFTKMWTSSAIMKLYEEGKIDIDAAAFPFMEPPYRKAMNESLVNKFGERIKNVTIRQLLGMRGGIPDYDEWDYQMKHPFEDLGPAESAHHFGRSSHPELQPGACGQYSSMSYELLGLVLIGEAGAESFAAYNQNVWGESFKNIRFATRGPCSDYTNINARCEACEAKGHSVLNFSCTNGYTCGNLMAHPRDTARFLWSLFSGKLVRRETLWEMLRAPKFGAAGATCGETCPQTFCNGCHYGLGIEFKQRFPDTSPFDFPGHDGMTYGWKSLNAFDWKRSAAYSVGAAGDKWWPYDMWHEFHKKVNPGIASKPVGPPPRPNNRPKGWMPRSEFCATGPSAEPEAREAITLVVVIIVAMCGFLAFFYFWRKRRPRGAREEFLTAQETSCAEIDAA